MNIATALSVSRIVLAIPGIALLYAGSPISALLVYLLAEFTDMIDGHVARKMNTTSKLGHIIDLFADKFLRTCYAIALFDLGVFPLALVLFSAFYDFASLALVNGAAIEISMKSPRFVKMLQGSRQLSIFFAILSLLPDFAVAKSISLALAMVWVAVFIAVSAFVIRATNAFQETTGKK